MADILIVVTDGHSGDRHATETSAQSLHNTNINVFAIGIGGNIDNSELEIIASKTENVYNVDNFDLLKTIHANLTETTCECKLHVI